MSGLLAFIVLLGSGPTSAQHADPKLEILTGPGDQPVQALFEARGWQRFRSPQTYPLGHKTVWLRASVPDDADRLILTPNPWPAPVAVMGLSGEEPLVTALEPDPGIAAQYHLHPPGIERPHTVYVRYGGQLAVPVGMTFDTRPPPAATTSMLAIGAYLGLVLLHLLYATGMFFGGRDRLYLFFGAYLTALATLLAMGFGLLPVTLVPLLAAIAVAAHLLFAVHYMKAMTPGYARLVRFSAAVVAVNGVLGSLFGNMHGTLLDVIVLTVPILLLAGAGVRLSLQGHRQAHIYLAATAGFWVAGIATALMLTGVLPFEFSPALLLLPASAVELVVYVIMLVINIRRQSEQEQQLRTRSLKLLQKVEDLESSRQLAAAHRELQKNIRQAQKLRTIGQMTGGIAHAFNNILASILGFAELAQDKSVQQDEAKLQRYLEEIESAGTRGAKLVAQLQLYSRPDHGNERTVDLSQTVAGTAEFLRRTVPITTTLELDLPDYAVPLRIDPTLLQQVLVNLVLNASEAMNERGAVRISLRREVVSEQLCASCMARFSGTHAVLRVDDEGGGIHSPIPDLFTPFHTTKPVGQGSGLGLSVVHGVVHDARGHVTVSPAPGRAGTRMAVYLPLLAANADAGARVGNRSILLVENDVRVSHQLTSELNANAYQVTCVSLPSEALEQFIRNPDGFDLVITGQAVASGTGLELAQELSELRPDMPIVLSADEADALTEETLRETGIRAVVTRPFDMSHLIATVKGLLPA